MLVIIALSAVSVVLSASGKIRKNRIASPINIIMAATFVTVFVAVLPSCTELLEDDDSVALIKVLKIVFMTFINTIQVFTVDAGSDIISGYNGSAGNMYIIVFSALSSLAPLLTVGFLINFVSNISAYNKFLTGFGKNTYIFSELSECSLALAEDIHSSEDKSMIVFASAADNELAEQAEEFGAVCFRKNITSVDFSRHSKKSRICFFVMNENDAECIETSLRLSEKYKNRNNTWMYIFSAGHAGEMAVSSISSSSGTSGLRVRRINRTQSMIYQLLYKEGDKIFRKADQNFAGEKSCSEPVPVNVVLTGLGKYGSEMLRALVWYCQMDGYRLRIDAFDSDPDALEKFSGLCPDIVSEKYNGTHIEGESDYTVRIYSGIDVKSYSFMKMLEQICEEGTVTYILVALGSDADNIEASADIRMITERNGCRPLIQTVVYNSELSAALKSVSNHSGDQYDIEFIGDLKSTYTREVILSSELEAEALERHKKWGSEEDFWKYEYNYKSSEAAAIHIKARKACGQFSGVSSESEKCLEHRRWNAYMRSEGFVYSSKRNNLAKTHHDLVSYYELSREEQQKDI